MTTAELADRLYRQAVQREHAAYAVRPGDDVSAIRGGIRALARKDGTKIRTGVWNGTLAVVRADAKIWTETTAVMEKKLSPTI